MKIPQQITPDEAIRLLFEKLSHVVWRNDPDIIRLKKLLPKLEKAFGGES